MLVSGVQQNDSVICVYEMFPSNCMHEGDCSSVFAQGSGGPENHHLQIPDVEAGRETMPRGIPIASSFIHSNQGEYMECPGL